MLRVLGCVAYDHDIGLVALSAIICGLGCFTATALMARAIGAERPRRWLGCAALLLGCSVWSLHFVAMLAFLPESQVSYAVGPTALSAAVAVLGSLAALLIWRAAMPRPVRVASGGILLGLSVAGMHYLGVAATTSRGVTLLDNDYVFASVLVAVASSSIALMRAERLEGRGRIIEVAAWLSLGICGLHFTGMTAISIVPGPVPDMGTVLVGSTTLAIAVAIVSIAILLGSLAAVLMEQHLSQRTMLELSRMRLLGNLAQEVLIIHRDGVVVEVNSAGERLFRATANSINGRDVLSLFTEDSAPAMLRRTSCPVADRRPEEFEVQAANGTRVTVELTCQPINYLGKPATVVALRDLTASKRDQERILYLARHDALTGLPNRYSLMERLEDALDAAARQGTGIALIYLDLDRFKPVNDLYGHAAGDALLVQVSRRLLAEMDPADTVARIGGDEFVVLLTTDARPARASETAARAVKALGRPFEVEGHRVEIGTSIGAAFYPENGANVDTLMRAADAAMYRAKEEGRGTVRFFEPAMNERLQARLQLKSELARAVELGELVLHYQPIVNAASGEVEGFEALIRWENPRCGLLGPARFIPLAEETGLIHEIGRWAIDTACEAAAGWPHPWRISINLSPVQFAQSDVCDAIDAAVRRHRLAPDRVVVEVTESVLMEETTQAVAMLNRLRMLGVKIALDDFGTGYSSLSYLQLFRFDMFKIDQSFVKMLGRSEDALTLTRTIVNLGHNLNLQVTAEGVETPAQLAILRLLGCDHIQGYLVSRPGPENTFTEIDRMRTRTLFAASGPHRAEAGPRTAASSA